MVDFSCPGPSCVIQPGHTYRATVDIGGIASVVANPNNIKDKISGLNFGSVWVSGSNESLPADWPADFRTADYFVQARYDGVVPLDANPILSNAKSHSVVVTAIWDITPAAVAAPPPPKPSPGGPLTAPPGGNVIVPEPPTGLPNLGSINLEVTKPKPSTSLAFPALLGVGLLGLFVITRK